MTAMRDDFNPDEFYGGPSRSQQRREALDVLALAGSLMDLTEGELSRVPLSESLRTQVDFARSITAHIARKREMQFLAKHLRKAEDELPAIRAAVEATKQSGRQEAAVLHRLEQWRDRLVRGDDDDQNAALQEFPQVERQTLRQLVRQAKLEAERGQPPAAARKLFRLLREAAEADASSRGSPVGLADDSDPEPQ
ncbi:MAG: DUF615 domain-containing protein [Ahniella sp.]|nr:DUF615 domain-containing protein [Ahniella sp.]